MTCFIIKLIILFFLGAIVEGNNFPGSRNIRGGSPVASASTFPFMASLRYSNYTPPYHFCGGSIIDKRHILTAAHCVRDRHPSFVIAVVGTIERFFATTSQKFGIEGWRMHARYVEEFEKTRRPTAVNDIALIRVDRNFDFSGEFVKPIPLDTTNFTRVNDDVVLIGFGYTEFDCSMRPARLQALVTSIVHPRYYQILHPDYDYSKDLLICTYAKIKNSYKGDDKHLFTTCSGDSGGPLIYLKGPKAVLVGVVSTNTRLFVNTAKVYAFIEDIELMKKSLA